jgi:hypothetical protein
MKRIISYSYNSFDLGCGCCSESFSTYDVFEDGKLVGDDVSCPVMENEEKLRDYLAHLEPFDVDSNSQYL